MYCLCFLTIYNVLLSSEKINRNCGSQPPRWPQWSLPPGIHALCNALPHCTMVVCVSTRIQCKWWYVTSNIGLQKTLWLLFGSFGLISLASLTLKEASYHEVDNVAWLGPQTTSLVRVEVGFPGPSQDQKWSQTQTIAWLQPYERPS